MKIPVNNTNKNISLTKLGPAYLAAREAFDKRITEELVPLVLGIAREYHDQLSLKNSKVIEVRFEDVPQALQRERGSQKMTILELSLLVDISVSTIVRFESGKNAKIAFDSIAKLARALGVELVLK